MAGQREGTESPYQAEIFDNPNAYGGLSGYNEVQEWLAADVFGPSGSYQSHGLVPRRGGQRFGASPAQHAPSAQSDVKRGVHSPGDLDADND